MPMKAPTMPPATVEGEVSQGAEDRPGRDCGDGEPADAAGRWEDAINRRGGRDDPRSGQPERGPLHGFRPRTFDQRD